MRVLICIILLMSLSITLIAQEYPMSITLTGPTFYNVLRLSSLDLQVPANQPLFFRVISRNETQQQIAHPYLFYSLTMNSEVLIEPNTRVRYRFDLEPGQQLSFTNRDIMTEVGSTLFDSPDPTFSALDVIDKIPEFRDIILQTGLLPDGTYTFTTQFRDDNQQNLSEEVSLTFVIRNPGGLFLISPGAPVGSTIPVVSGLPVNFLWSSNLVISPYNPFTLKIKEFDDLALLSYDFLVDEGPSIYNGWDYSVEVQTVNYYSGYLPLQEGKYYIWQISTPLIDPTVAEAGMLSSPIYAFRYSVSESGGYDNEITMNAIRIYLMNLNIQWVTELLNSGFDPSGVINYNGTVWSGQGAEQIIHQISDRAVTDVKLAE